MTTRTKHEEHFPVTDVSPDMLLGDRYQLSQRIAGGAMGDVWTAKDQLLMRQVAVKIAKASLSEDAIFRRRFRLEAQSAAALSDPAIASVFDYGEETKANGEHLAYIVMELVEGESLNQLLSRGMVLDIDQTLQVVSEVSHALQVAHDRGIVHRDIKPANILIRSDGRIKITDFGIARAADTGDLTQTGMMLGTVQYMAPEQLSGRAATGAADIYALGVVAYLCLSGVTPFAHSEPMTVAMAHVNDPVPPLPAAVPAAVGDLVLQMLAKDPQRRPASAGEVSARAISLRSSLQTASNTSHEWTPTPTAETVVDAAAVMEAANTELTAVLPAPTPGELAIEDRPLLGERRRLAIIVGLLMLAVVLLVVALAPSGPSIVRMPNVTGLSASTAAARLKTSGLSMEISRVDSNQASGIVLSQTPRAGESVPSTDRAALEVSNGKENVNAAALDGQPYAMAAASITALGLVPSEKTVTSTAIPGTVLSVTPSGQVAVGSPVTLTVAIAPAPIPGPGPDGGPPGHAHGHGHGKGQG